MARIVEDFLREDVRRFGLTGSQWTAVATVSLCLFTLAVLRRTPRWGRWDETPVPAAGPAEDSGEAGESREHAILNEDDRGPEP